MWGRGAGRPVTPSRRAGRAAAPCSQDLEVRELAEMAEASPLVWVRGPGFGCEAVRCASARCSVRDLIRRHCHDRVSFALPGRKGDRKADRGRIGWGEGGRGPSLP